MNTPICIIRLWTSIIQLWLSIIKGIINVRHVAVFSHTSCSFYAFYTEHDTRGSLVKMCSENNSQMTLHMPDNVALKTIIQNNITRAPPLSPWPQKMAVFIGQWWHLEPPFTCANKEICTLLVKLHIICSIMQRVNPHVRPSIIKVGCPTCCYQVCALVHAKGGTADLLYHSEPCHRNDEIVCSPCLYEYPNDS